MRNRLVWCLSASALLTLCPSSARATDPPVLSAPAPTSASTESEVRLTDGSMVRGRVTERRADGTLTILLVTGESRVIPGNRIASVSGLRGPATATPPPSSPAPSTPPTQSDDDASPVLDHPAPGRVPVVFESRNPRLEVGLAGEMVETMYANVQTYARVCRRTPCTVYVRPGRQPSFWSGGANPDGSLFLISRTFDLDVPPCGLRVRLRADPPLRGLALIGTVFFGLVATGAGALFVGGLIDNSSSMTMVGGLALAVAVPMFAWAVVGTVLDRGGVQSRTPLEPIAAGRARFSTPQWSVSTGMQGVAVDMSIRF